MSLHDYGLMVRFYLACDYHLTGEEARRWATDADHHAAIRAGWAQRQTAKDTAAEVYRAAA